MSDVLGLIITTTWVLVFLIGSEFAAVKNKISKETARKIIHISVGHVIFFVPMFESKWLAAGIPFLFVFGNLMLSPASPIEKIRLKTFKAGHTFGTVLYPLSLSIVTFVFFDKPYLIMIAFFPVVYGDGLAAVIGPKFPIKEFSFWENSTKSLAGSITVWLASLISIMLGVLIMDLAYESISVDFLTIFALAWMSSIIGTLVEIFSPKGTDNFFIPLVILPFLLI